MGAVTGLATKIMDPLFGADTQAEDDQAAQYAQQAAGAYGNMVAPTLSAANVIPYQDVGQLANPAQVSYNLGPAAQQVASQQSSTALNSISTDPRLEDDQMGALSSLQNIANSGGLTDADKANLSQIQGQIAQQNRGNTDAIMNSVNARGMGGSGTELLAKMQSGQNATQNAYQNGLTVAGQAQQNALNAIASSGNLAGNIRNQDYQEQSNKAAAQDAINRFNAQNSTSANAANASAANNFATSRAAGGLSAQNSNNANAMQVGQYNLNNAQNISNANSGLMNQQAQQQAALPQQTFQNQMSIAQGKSGAAGQGANYYNALGARKSQTAADYMSSLLGVGAAVAGKPSTGGTK